MMDSSKSDKLQKKVSVPTLLFLLTITSLLVLITVPTYSEEPVKFPDEKLEQAIRNAIDKDSGDIYPSDLERLMTLFAPNPNKMGIKDLTGIEYCKNLFDLSLHINNISDISPLAGLTDLEYLSLDDNNIRDISPLAGLNNLEHLTLGDNDIRYIYPLARLTDTDLTLLDLRDNNIRDIRPLAFLTSLESITLSKNNISDISPLAGNTYSAGLTDLLVLFLDENNIRDISPLAELTSLGWLNLSKNNISDISPLAGLTDLGSIGWLNLSKNNISDISPLVDNEGLGNGDGIDLGGNYLDLSEGSEDMKNIQTLIDRGVSVFYEPQKEITLTAFFNYSPSDPITEETITFDASASLDPDDNITQYEWDWDDDGTYEDTSSSPIIQHSFATSGNHTVTLKVVDNDGATNTSSLQLQVEALVGAAPPPEVETVSTVLDSGYNLISPPGEPQEPDPQNALGDNIDPLYMYRWNPAKGDYDGVSSIQLKAGESYWVYAWEDGTEIDLEISSPADYSIDLSGEGWQMVGSPYSIDWGDIKVDGTKVRNDETSDSSYSGPLKPYIFSYDEADNEYDLAQPSGWKDLSLNKWDGYWVKTTDSDVGLSFDKGDASSASASALESDNQNVLVTAKGKGLSLPPAPPPMKPSKVEGLQAVVSPTLVRDSAEVTFAVRSEQPIDGLQAKVLDPKGQEVWTEETSGSELNWDTAAVANGIYLYTVSAKVDGELQQAGIGKLLVLK